MEMRYDEQVNLFYQMRLEHLSVGIFSGSQAQQTPISANFAVQRTSLSIRLWREKSRLDELFDAGLGQVGRFVRRHLNA